MGLGPIMNSTCEHLDQPLRREKEPNKKKKSRLKKITSFPRSLVPSCHLSFSVQRPSRVSFCNLPSHPLFRIVPPSTFCSTVHLTLFIQKTAVPASFLFVEKPTSDICQTVLFFFVTFLSVVCVPSRNKPHIHLLLWSVSSSSSSSESASSSCAIHVRFHQGHQTKQWPEPFPQAIADPVPPHSSCAPFLQIKTRSIQSRVAFHKHHPHARAHQLQEEAFFHPTTVLTRKQQTKPPKHRT